MLGFYYKNINHCCQKDFRDLEKVCKLYGVIWCLFMSHFGVVYITKIEQSCWNGPPSCRLNTAGMTSLPSV